MLSFAGERTGELVTQTLVLTEHITDLASAYSYIACRNIRVRADMALQFGHERLAETHYFGVGFATRREVRTSLGTAHRKGCEGVLEGLLERKELHDREVDRGMETDTTFVRTDGGVHLHAETAVDLHFALVVHPRHAEHDDALRLHDTLHNLLLAQIRIRHNHRSYRLNDFFDCLVKLVLTGVLCDEVSHKAVHVQLCLFIHKTNTLYIYITLLTKKSRKDTKYF